MPNYLQRVAMSGSGAGVVARPPAAAPVLTPRAAFDVPPLNAPAADRTAAPVPVRGPATSLPVSAERSTFPAPQVEIDTEIARGPERQEADVIVETQTWQVSPPEEKAEATRRPQFTPPAPAARGPVAASRSVRVSLPGIQAHRVIDLPRTLRPLEGTTDYPVRAAEPEDGAAQRDPKPPRIEPANSPTPAAAPLILPPPAARTERVSRIEIGQIDVQVFPVAAPQSSSPSRPLPSPRTDPLEARFLNRFLFRL